MTQVDYRITRYRKRVNNSSFHGFFRLYWINKIKVDLSISEVVVHWKFGFTTTYIMEKSKIYYLLRDCGFTDGDLETQ